MADEFLIYLKLAQVTRAILDGRPVALVRERPWPLPALPANVTESGVPRLAYRGTGRIMLMLIFSITMGQ